ncbi:MAG: hypothetical protein M3Z24_15460 [Chloroflexota bacterium]|nr:hypothetical protein [Chloroflexota bacterium]
MYLLPHQTARFYRIWFALLHYVNEQRQLIADFPDVPEKASILPSDALQLRDALWADDRLRETFIAENPAGLPPVDLALVSSWQYRLAGNFYIVRYLKKHTIFLSEAPAHAYGVLGLVSPIEEIAGPTVPVYVQAVLLPFEGQIIYDSLLAPYRITFGSGIRSSLNDAYRNTQEREGIITTLGSGDVPVSLNEVRNRVLARNAKILGAFRKDMARAGLSNKMIEHHVGNIDTFAQTYLLSQEPPHGLLDITITDMQAYLYTAENKTNPISFKRFFRFLAETGRMDYEQVEPLRDFLKQAQE